MGSSRAHLTYMDYVKHRAQSNPCINGLDRYLQRRATLKCKAAYIPDIGPHTSRVEPTVVEGDKLASLIGTIRSAKRHLLLIIEDIDPPLISLLGSTLDVDPIFFADYVNTSFENIETAPPPPSLAILPSLLSQGGCLHLHYQQVLDLGTAGAFRKAAYALKTDSNVTRNIRRLAPLSGKQLALARATCSLLVKKTETASICIALVDRPARLAVEGLGTPKQNNYPARRLHGGFEDFDIFHAPSSSTDCQGKWNRDSMLDSLVHYTRSQKISDHHHLPMGILTMAYHPIRIVLSEWNLYMHLISRYSKHYEYSLHDITSRLHGDDIIDLQRWRRRIRQSRHKLVLVAEFVEFWMQHEDNQNGTLMIWKMVLRDVNYLQSQLQDYSQSLEQMVTVATSMIQLLESRRSILEAINVRRLTYIALVFAPLAWVASLFSMSEDYSPGHDGFWIYFATALPLVGTVILLSAYRWGQASHLLQRLWGNPFSRFFSLSTGQRQIPSIV